jgi:serine/threonine protein kinase
VDKNKIDYPVDIPIEAKEFIECLVQKDPAHRPKCHDLLKFKLFTTYLQKGQKQKKNQ